MKRLQTIFVILLAIDSLAFRMPGLTPLAAQQKGPLTSGPVVTQQENQTAIDSASPKEIKVMREFRGIKLGMKRDEVRDALGKPELSDKGQDSFKIGGDDRLTTHYDNDSVNVIQLYVVGDREIEERSDGSKIARVEIPVENFWISMFQGKSGDVTTITISRLRN
jgi:hypothetical protein